MADRLTKIMTRTGDDGFTTLAPKMRVAKDDERISVLGSLDELNAALGIVVSTLTAADEEEKKFIAQVQNTLFNLGGELCPPFHLLVKEDDIIYLEKILLDWNATLPTLKEFVIPGGTLSAAFCHLARTICRRAERDAVTLYQLQPFSNLILKYLNRLSDCLFVLARRLNRNANETIWEHDRP